MDDISRYIKKGFKNFGELKKFIKNNNNREPLHRLLENRMKVIIEEMGEGLIQNEQYSVPGGRTDSVIYYPTGITLHFEYFCSIRQVSQDLRLLENSPYNIKIAVLLDDDLKKDSIIKEYFHKKPVNPFPVIFVSEVLLSRKKSILMNKLKVIINQNRDNLILSKNKELRNHLFDCILKNVQKLWNYLITKPVGTKEKFEREVNFNIKIEEPYTNLFGVFNLLEHGLMAGVNIYSRPDINNYRSDLVELLVSLQDNTLNYISKMDQLFILISKELNIDISEKYEIIHALINALLNNLKFTDEGHVGVERKWYNDNVKIYEEKIKANDKIIEVVNEIELIFNMINNVRWQIINIIEYEKYI